ncbi:hypothetical protein RHMOL_Rhmol10G0074500 [Rhododendron molle]|uniref:Uncharacterized protein n=1 Tax=Rhododendron molle TaxID=49168 RepID=A0ACC0M0X4_RHOML|nr:hypothetical protein RHMOL_Rhmol10G0074500 [Rhododendron molle]
MDDIWGDEGVSSGRVRHPEKGGEESSKVMQPDVVGEVVKTPRAEITGATAGEGLAVPLDSLEMIGTFEQDVAVHRVMNDILEDEGVSSREVSYPWKGKSLRHMRSLSVVQGEEGEEEMRGEEEGMMGMRVMTKRTRRGVDRLRKRIDQMAILLELPSWRDRLEKVSKELKEVEATAERLTKRKKKLEGEVAKRESASLGSFDMSNHAGQGLRQ